MASFTRFVLLYNSIQVGTYVHGFLSSFARATPINVRHNFWDTSVILDGSYPALVWDHDITLYTESGSLKGLAEQYFALSTLVSGVPAPLTISYASSPGLALINFGSCLLNDRPGVQKPEQLLLQEAGFFTVSFLGSTKPV
jgi:hypothetical protein